MIEPGSNAAPASYWIETEDWHTAGQPFRIVENLPEGHLPDATSVAARRTVVINTPFHPLGTLRQTLCHEPRGHADMYGGFIVPPNDSGAHFGVLFWHKDGFSTACGHGTIALGCWAVTRKLVQVPAEDGVVDVVIDVPSGRVSAKVAVKNRKPIHADFVNVSSYGVTTKIPVAIQSRGGDVMISLAYGGAYSASVDASQLELSVEPPNVSAFVAIGREIKAVLAGKNGPPPCGIYDVSGVIFFEDEAREPHDSVDTLRQRNVTIFADGQVDRSPCGSGTCARLATLLAEGKMRPGREKLVHRSIIGTVFEGDLVSQGENINGFPTCIPRVRGAANLVGRTKFFIDPEDPVYPGFLLG
ncbi:Diaminopimelate epimerase-like protein [Ophiobolus disseminans]|uniref:trans-L-3-hydroxyproline dehydratase n=1 Tax=Ophiobolus disseminans TaxID=1469910 RepID=A0A6A7A416_9PLEO|nr:Diaminopimelate epimerase-like protein [Ophiobolus disseminans]